jgi:DNA repair protein RadD
MQPYPYQQNLIDSIYDSWQSNKRVLAQLATGGGKSVILGTIVKDHHDRGLSVLVVAHRDELINQLCGTLRKITGKMIGVVKAGHKYQSLLRIQVASIQSLNAKRLVKLRRPDLIIIDECHHCTKINQYGKLFDYFDGTKILGVTATPVRGDNKPLGDCFEDMRLGVDAKYLFDNGYLCQYNLYAPAQKIAPGKITRGEYDAADMMAKNEVGDLTNSAVKAYLKYCAGKTAIAFCLSVEYSLAQAEAYNAAGIKAVHLDGTTDKKIRAETLKDLSDKKIDVICNYALFGEGVDIPSIEAVQIVRKTKSLSLWLQMFGRALRVSPGKDVAIVIDHGENYKEHGLPDEERHWSLDVEVKNKPKEREEDEDGLIEREPVEKTVIQLEQDIQLISNPIKARRYHIFQDKIKMFNTQGYSPGWIYYQLQDCDYPIECWLQAAEIMDRSPGWAAEQKAKTLQNLNMKKDNHPHLVSA